MLFEIGISADLLATDEWNRGRLYPVSLHERVDLIGRGQQIAVDCVALRLSMNFDVRSKGQRCVGIATR